MKRALVTSTVLLALLGIGSSIEHFLGDDHYNPGFIEHPAIIRLHVVLGAAYLVLAMPQFLAALRARRPALHRTVGRLAIVVGLAAAFIVHLAVAEAWVRYTRRPRSFAPIAPARAH